MATSTRAEGGHGTAAGPRLAARMPAGLFREHGPADRPRVARHRLVEPYAYPPGGSS
jgi:hypothetical protein